MMLKINSVTFRLTLTILLIVSVFHAFQTVFFTRRMEKDIESLSSSQLMVIATYAAQDIDRDIRRRHEFLANRARMAPGTAMDWRDWIAGLSDPDQLFPSGLFVVDRQGAILAKTPGAPDRDGDPVLRPETITRAITDGFTLGRARMNRRSESPELAMAMPITGADGTLLIGITPLRCPNFLGTLANTKVGKTGGLVVVSPRDKLVLAASDSAISLFPTPPEGAHPQHDRAMKGFRGVGIDTRIGGIQELAAIASIPATDWFVVARVPTREIFEPAANIASFATRSAVILGLLLSLAIVLISRHLLRHLRRAAAHADLMTQGEIPLKPLPVAGNDEVGHLTAAFNRLLTSLLASKADLERLALHDNLTGVANRRQFTGELERYLAKAKRHGDIFAVFYIDLDGFKPVNDTFGHEAGDEVLRQMTRRLSGIIRAEDLLARIGGDEFALLIGGLHDAETETVAIIAKCHKAMAEPIRYGEHHLAIGLSIGAACYPSDGETIEDLLASADRAMYRAKHARTEPTSSPLRP